MRWNGVSVAVLTLVFAAGAAIADHQGGAAGGAAGGAQGAAPGSSVVPRSTIPGYRLVVRNRCSQTISMAYRVRDYTRLWVTRGWFHIRPGRTRTLPMPTRNKTFYYYGFMQSGRSRWDGKGKAGSIRRWVRNRPFLHSSGNLAGAGARMVSFRKRDVRANGIYSLNMSCTSN